MKVPGDIDETVEMIGIGVGKGQDGDAGDLLAPQKRRHHLSTHVENTIVGKTAAVHQQHAAAGKFHECGCPLPHIDGRDPEIAVPEALAKPV